MHQFDMKHIKVIQLTQVMKCEFGFDNTISSCVQFLNNVSFWRLFLNTFQAGLSIFRLKKTLIFDNSTAYESIKIVEIIMRKNRFFFLTERTPILIDR